MKKFSVSIAIAVALLLVGCAAKMVVYDKSVPSEKLCFLNIPNDITINEIDDKKVSFNHKILQIAEGHHTFLADCEIPTGRTYTVGGTARNGQPFSQTRTEVLLVSNIRCEYVFKAGDSYLMNSVGGVGYASISITKKP